MKKVSLLSIDCEFTSFDMMGGDLLSVAFVEILEDLTLGREWQGYLRPRGTKYFTESAREIHGISYFKAETFPERRKTIIDMLNWLESIYDYLPAGVAYFGSWNFDLKWVEYTMDDVGLRNSFNKAFKINKDDHFNVFKECKNKLKHIQAPRGSFDSEKSKEKGRYKLDNIAKFYGLDHNHHDSLSDARVTAQIYCNLMNNDNTWTGELF